MAVLTMALIPLLAFMTVSNGAAKVFGWFVDLVCLADFEQSQSLT